MRNLFILLVIAAASYQLYTRYRSAAASACDEYGNPQTLLFTMNRCQPCDDARALLIKRGVEFEEFNVSYGEARAKKMKSYGAGRSFPYLFQVSRRCWPTSIKDYSSRNSNLLSFS